MEADFWHQKWQKNEIGFHEPEANPSLVKYLDILSLAEASRLFLPLCGKTLDIAWLLSKGYRVAAIELSKIAVEQLFTELEIKPTITQVANMECYSAKNIDIFVGDFFELTSAMLGPIDAIYDRAALIALPETTRPTYASHLIAISHSAPQLLITLEYDQSVMNGPPFSVNGEAIKNLYQDYYTITLQERFDLAEDLKGKCPAVEGVWLLT